MSNTKQRDTWPSYAFRLVVSSASHPFEYAKILIQIGHEPIAPRPSKTLFGKPALKLPNIFEYVKYIKSVDGISGCYRGLVPKLCGNIMGALASQKMVEVLHLENDDDDGTNELISLIDQSSKSSKRSSSNEELSEAELLVKSLQKELVGRISVIIVSHPFHVITIRMMAQFVGRETKYNGLFQSISEIYKENGAIGFFSGIVPRVLGEMFSIILASTFAYAVNNFVFHQDKELHSYITATMSFIASAITYPFQVVSNCMTVTGSGLMAGTPPYMPHYTSWVDCWNHLSERNQLKRGSSILIRYYVGPQMTVGGRTKILGKDQLVISNNY